MPHVVLLGDSVFDNAVYVPDGPPVADQLRGILPEAWSVTLLAVDGDVTPGVEAQLRWMPDDATDLVVSCGGNDALNHLPLLAEEAGSVAEVLARFAEIRSEFGREYRSMLEKLVALRRRVAVCTVYDCIPDLGPIAHTALSMFNELILREAIAAGVTIIDLRLVCTEPLDYSEVSPIEPSRAGGEKIAAVIRDVLLDVESPGKLVKVYR